MKTYRSTRAVLAEAVRTLSPAQPVSHRSPLDEITGLLSRGRHYLWVGIYLAVDARRSQPLLGAGRDPHPGQMDSPEARAKVLISIAIAGRELGILDVESEHDHAFGGEDRVLLVKVADLLARFLTGRGKYLVRKANAIRK